jgi:phenylpropionate dioxygenase-like ring-hydroxylating dioxygenase large terminal subunit
VTVLRQCEPTLPTAWYRDPAHFQRELEALWYHGWICVGRADELAETGDYSVHRIGDQRVLITRAADGELHAMHNTCRHRGAELCAQAQGRFRQARIVCPYHAWTYDLSGALTGTPHRLPGADFDPAQYGLYRVALAQWRGFVFVNLEREPPPLQTLLGEAGVLAHWPLETLALAHRETHQVECNWKVFWENYSECYHCPRVHPELCQIVPMYGRAVVSLEDDPRRHSDRTAADITSPMAPGAVTWTLDGRSTLPPLDGLDERERAAGMTFLTLLPSMFIVAHVDYVRSVRVRPLAPEQTELIVDWLLPATLCAQGELALEPLLELGRRVVQQDASVCEINQRGLRSRAHAAGVLVGNEHGVYELQQWIRARLAERAPD